MIQAKKGARIRSGMTGDLWLVERVRETGVLLRRIECSADTMATHERFLKDNPRNEGALSDHPMGQRIEVEPAWFGRRDLEVE